MVARANRKRVFYLDLLKFVSIYAMIVCHLFYIIILIRMRVRRV